MPDKPFKNPDMEHVFDNYPPEIKSRLLRLRDLIVLVASETPGVGELEETLKWGQPSFLTTTSRSGTTIRIDQVKNDPQHYAMYLSCQTTLIETFRMVYPDFRYDGNRAIIFAIEDDLPIEVLKDFIGMALTYHLRKKQKLPHDPQ